MVSDQRRRSRYESVLALMYLTAETPGLSPIHRQQAMRRAASRAWLFARRENGCGLFSPHFLRLVRSRLPWTEDAQSLIAGSLAAFTEDGRIQRPAAWRPPGSPPQPLIDGEGLPPDKGQKITRTFCSSPKSPGNPHKHKAGLSPDHWSDNFAVWRFVVAVALSTDGVIAKGED